MKLEKAIKDDLQEILTLQKQCFKPSAEFYGNPRTEPMIQTVADLEQEYEYKTFFVIKDNGTIIGSVRCEIVDDTCHIGKLIVMPSRQNSGLGKFIMHGIEEFYSDIKHFELFTGCRDEKNLYFYQSIGYKIFKYKQLSDDFKFVYLEKFI